MDQLIKLVTEKAGISPEQAQAAVSTVVGFIKEKLPAGLGSQLDGLIGGEAGGGMPNLGDIAGKLGGLGGMFGGDSK
ncbi:MAG: hypothetical protein ACRC8S_14085 [Fimbriiglobus sp.]